MDHPDFIVGSFMEISIGLKRANTYWLWYDNPIGLDKKKIFSVKLLIYSYPSFLAYVLGAENCFSGTHSSHW